MEFTDKPLEPFGEKLLDMSIPTQLSLKTPLVFRIVKVLASKGCLPATGSQAAELCFDEALTNAMMHGNKLDPSRKVKVSLFADSERWGAIIEDDGDGFRPEDVPRKDDEEYFVRESGRGIILMSGYVDEILYNSKGNRLFIAKRRQTNPDTIDMEAAVEAATVAMSMPLPTVTGPVSVSVQGDVAVVEVLAPRLNETNVEDVRGAVAGTSQSLLVLDLTRVEYVSSRGVTALVTARKAVEQRKGKLVVAGLQAGVREVLKSLGLLAIFKVVPDARSGMSELHKP
jgi:serine/threonine-protein kinase RsbW